jgi:hypothetical protein
MEARFQAVLKEMRRNQDDAGILEKACASLRDLGNKGIFPQGILTRAIKAVRMAMDRFPDHGNLQESSLFFMATIYSPDQKTTAAVVAKEGCIPAVLKAMRSHPSRYAIQQFACQVLYQLSYGMEPRYVRELWKERALDTVFETLQARLKAPRGEDADPQNSLQLHQMFAYNTVTAMFAVAHLECEDSSIFVLPDLKVLAYSMARHSEDAGLMRDGMCAIYITVGKVPQHADILGVAGIKAVMDGMRAHEDDFKVQLAGVLVLRCLVNDSPERQRFADKLGCIEFVHRAMRVYTAQAAFQRYACHFISDMIDLHGNDERRVKIAELGIITTLAAALRAHASNQELSECACTALARLSRVESPRHKYLMLTERACDAILSALQRHKNDKGLLLSGCQAITLTLKPYRFIPPTSVDEYCEIVQFTRKAEPIILEILSNNITIPHFAAVCSDIFSCINNLEGAHDPELDRRVGISLFVRGLHTHTDSEVLFAFCRGWSESVLKYPEACREEGVMEALLAMVEKIKHDHSAVLCIRGALRALTDRHAENRAHLNKIMTKKQVKILQQSESAHPTIVANMQEIAQSYPQYFSASYMEDTKADLQALTEKDTVAQKLFDREKEKKAESCTACGKTAGELGLERMLRCSACTLRPWYCSAECQRACWGAHKAECKANRVQKGWP